MEVRGQGTFAFSGRPSCSHAKENSSAEGMKEPRNIKLECICIVEGREVKSKGAMEGQRLGNVWNGLGGP